MTKTVADLVDERADRHPERIGFRFLSARGEYDCLAYGQLRLRAGAAAGLLADVCQPGDRALLLLETGPGFVTTFFGCAYAGVVAVPTAVSGSRREVIERGSGIAEDCEPRCIVVDRSRVGLAEAIRGRSRRPADIVVLAVEDMMSTAAARGHSDLALLQYTSGSTSSPKGARITHANLLHNANAIGVAFEFSQESVGVGWLPLFHDMGLVGNVVVPLAWNFPVSLMSPTAMLRRPATWLEAVSDARATVSGGPDFAFRLCVDRIDGQVLDRLDLGSWRVAYTGGEQVSAETLRRFADRFGRCGFRRSAFLPCYGLAEATLLVAGRRSDEPPVVVRADRAALARREFLPADVMDRAAEFVAHELVPQQCGVEVRILAPASDEEVAPGVVGEIEVAGGGVTPGYWGDTMPGLQVSRLRTGDLGMLHQGRLLVVDRIKDTIIIRGRNYYATDLEASIEAALAVEACAFGAPAARGEGLVIAVGHRKAAAAAHISAAAVQRILTEQFSIRADDVVIVPASGFARTTSGKLRRHEMRRRYLAGELSPDVPLADTPAEDTSLPRAAELCTWIRDYVATRVDLREMDERRSMAPHVVLDFGRRGILGLEAPREYGGSELSTTGALRVVEQLASLDLSLAAFVGVQNALGLRPLLDFASPLQRTTWLPAAAAGRILIAFALTEEGAGSNPRALKTTARQRPGGGWVLSGEKIWIGTAAWAGLLIVVARASAADGRPLGITAFLVPTDTAGVRLGAEAPTMGVRSMVQNRVSFENVVLPRDAVLGTIGHGMEVAQAGMSVGRLGIAAMSVGALKRVAQIMIEFAARRSVATGLLLDHPVASDRCRSAVCAARALERLLAGVVATLDAARPVPEELLAICKLIATELLWDAVDDVMQVTGGRGYMESSGVPRMFRDARLLRIFEGPTETLAWAIGSRVLRENGSTGVVLGSRAAASAAGRRLENTIKAALAEPFLSGQHLWLAHNVGWAAAWTALAAAREAEPLVDDSVDEQDWIACRVTDALDRIATPRKTVSTRALTHAAAAYRRQLGALECASLGLETASLLRPKPAPVEIAESATAPPPSAAVLDQSERVARQLVAIVAARATIAERDVSRDVPFAQLGLDSVDAAMLADSLSERLGVAVEPTIFWDHPTIDALSRHLAGLSEQHREVDAIDDVEEALIRELGIGRTS